MKILWVNPHFLHPTTKGGQIRTLEMLRHLHRWHEVHYVALDNPAEPEGLRRSPEYCSRAYPVPHRAPPRRSPSFVLQAMANLASPLPLAVSRYRSPAMRRLLADLLHRERFDRLVCDFLFPAPNIPSLAECLLFQHNIETTIWQRHLETAPDPLRRQFFRLQARRMAAYEGSVCRQAGQVVAVSVSDADHMRRLFGLSHVAEVPTGVDVEFFAPQPAPAEIPAADLIFVGSMDWLPNIDGAAWFVTEVLPLIRQRRPHCSLAIVGRRPPPKILHLARQDASILVTGTVPDIRPYFWRSSVSIVPLRIGGGTRLKIFEAMAARVPVVSTSIGAEGLPVSAGENIALADTPVELAGRCLQLLEDASLRARIAGSAWEMVSSRFSWEQAARCFERILERGPRLQA